MPNTRTRAWRRAQRQRVLEARSGRYDKDPFTNIRHKGMLAKTSPRIWKNWGIEKKWGNLYLHSVKLNRARQLGYLWPNPKKQLEGLLED